MKHLLEMDHIGYAVKDIEKSAALYVAVGWTLSEIYEEKVQHTKIAFLNALVLSPLIFMTARFWIRIIKNETVKYKKYLLLLSSLMVFLVIPLITSHTDQARWFYDIVIFEIIVIGSICLMNRNNERSALSGITKITIPKLVLILFYFVFYWNTYITVISQFLLPSILGWSALFITG